MSDVAFGAFLDLELEIAGPNFRLTDQYFDELDGIEAIGDFDSGLWGARDIRVDSEVVPAHSLSRSGFTCLVADLGAAVVSIIGRDELLDDVDLVGFDGRWPLPIVHGLTDV